MQIPVNSLTTAHIRKRLTPAPPGASLPPGSGTGRKVVRVSQSRKPTRRRRWLWVAGGSAAAACLTVLVLYLMVQRRPGWYRPAVVATAEDVQRVQADAAAMGDYISQRLVQHEPVEVLLREESVNEWLAVLPRTLTPSQNPVPAEVPELAISFQDGRIKLGGLVEHDGWRTIVSVTLRLEITPDERSLTLALEAVHGGALGMPKAAVSALLQPMIDAARTEANRQTGEQAVLLAPLRKLESPEQLYDGVHIENRLVWPNGERPFRVAELSLEDGVFRALLQPL